MLPPLIVVVPVKVFVLLNVTEPPWLFVTPVGPLVPSARVPLENV